MRRVRTIPKPSGPFAFSELAKPFTILLDNTIQLPSLFVVDTDLSYHSFKCSFQLGRPKPVLSFIRKLP